MNAGVITTFYLIILFLLNLAYPFKILRQEFSIFLDEFQFIIYRKKLFFCLRYGTNIFQVLEKVKTLTPQLIHQKQVYYQTLFEVTSEFLSNN